VTYRCSFFAQQKSTLRGCWSENFWNSSGSLPAVQSAALSLRNALNLVTGAQVFFPQLRIADATTFRNVLNIPFPNAAPSAISSSAPDADYPSTALLIKLNASGNYSTKQWLRGLPDNVTDLSGTYQPTALFTGRLNALFKLLTDGSQTWAINVLNRANPFQPITAINGTTGTVTCPAHGFAPGAKVRITGVHGLTQANGVWTITVISADQFSLNFWAPPSVVVPALGKKPSARLQSYIQVQIASCEFVRITSHRTGRPIGLLGGRRRKRAS